MDAAKPIEEFTGENPVDIFGNDWRNIIVEEFEGYGEKEIKELKEINNGK